MRQFTAMTLSGNGSTQAVTIRAKSIPEAKDILLAMGYFAILWVI